MKRAVIFAFLVFGPSCAPQPTDADKDKAAAAAADEKDPRRGAPVAKIGGKVVITVGQLTDALNRRNPHIRMRYTSLARKKAFLKNMAHLEVLSAEARRRNLDKDPEVVRRVKSVMVDRLMEQLYKEQSKFEISDADARAYFEKHRDKYQQPARVRVSQLVVKTAAEAKKALALARKKPGNTRHFAELVGKLSIDAASKGRRGDLGFFSADDERLPPEVVKAAHGIGKLWELAGPIETNKGYVILMKTGQRAAIDRPFESEKARIKNVLFNERRFDAVNKYVENLKKQTKIEIVERNLASVKVKPPQKGERVSPHDRHGKHPPDHRH